ncbi:glutathione S-transferase family protein [Paraburkholderia sp. BCC1884]|uniref:glutathione S-transferase family protein n=1 Tax=Paraburkholderia sp. BCC1884 TaxID=2562668 RepID=UPI0011844A79|nr:glutathione S-transferase [Paraburkholderia sp. BCC1884]
MKLYCHPRSGHSHRARLFLSLLGEPHEIVEVDLKNGKQKSPEFLKLNPFGQVPVLVDGDTVIADSNSILVYLAKKLKKTDWLPEEAEAAARVQRWLSVAAGEIAYGPAAARQVALLGAPFNAIEVIGRAHRVLKQIDNDLQTRDYITGKTMTIADVALYSYIARAPEGNVDLSSYTRISEWLRRIEALPGYVEFQKTPVSLTANAN